MRLRHRLLVLAPAFALATTGFAAVMPGQALAGVGPSQECSDGYPSGSEIPILNAPITLGVESPTFGGNVGPTYLQVCYSTSANGSSSTPSEGGVFDVYVAYPGAYPGPGTGVACANDGTTIVAVDCGLITNPTATFTPNPGGGGTVTLALPIKVCLSTGPIPAGGCFAATPTVGSTGIIVGTFALTPPPAGYTTGGGFTLTGLALVANGTVVPLPVNGTTQVGINPAVLGAGIGPGATPLCVLGICAPGVWVGEQPISAGEISVAGHTVTIPPVVLGCIVNLNTTCPPPY